MDELWKIRWPIEQIHPLTRERAEQHLRIPALPGERDISKTRLAWISQCVANGEVIAFRWAVVHVGGLVYRLNGQTSAKVLASCEHIDPTWGATCEHYEAGSMGGAKVLWGQFDNVRSGRTKCEVVRTFTAELPVFQELPKNHNNILVSAFAFLKWGGAVNKITHTEKCKLLVGNEHVCGWISNMLSCDEYRSLHRVGVVAAMIDAAAKDIGKAMEFWSQTQAGSNPNVDHPTRSLQRFLLTEKSSNGQGGSQGGKVTAWEFYDRCKRHFEAFVDGRTIKRRGRKASK